MSSLPSSVCQSTKTPDLENRIAYKGWNDMAAKLGTQSTNLKSKQFCLSSSNWALLNRMMNDCTSHEICFYVTQNTSLFWLYFSLIFFFSPTFSVTKDIRGPVSVHASHSPAFTKAALGARHWKSLWHHLPRYAAVCLLLCSGQSRPTLVSPTLNHECILKLPGEFENS